MKTPKISLIITTYNWPEALNAVLHSVSLQNIMPHEIIIADDGSTDETKKTIEKWTNKLTAPLIHSWQEDAGFRLSESRNRAIAKSSGEYIIMIDGDMVLSKDFISSYTASIKPGFFIQGGRAQTNERLRNKIFNNFFIPHFFSKGIKNRKNTISNSVLAKIFSFERNNDNSTRGCNMGFWKSDVEEINGFNSDFVGWGREDSEFVIRMLNAGKRRLYLKFAAIAFHLYHPESSRNALPENDKLLKLAIQENKTYIENGLDKI